MEMGKTDGFGKAGKGGKGDMMGMMMAIPAANSSSFSIGKTWGKIGKPSQIVLVILEFVSYYVSCIFGLLLACRQ